MGIFNNIFVIFSTAENADEFCNDIFVNGHGNKFERTSEKMFCVSFPFACNNKECATQVECFMWDMGYALDADYSIIKFQ